MDKWKDIELEKMKVIILFLLYKNCLFVIEKNTDLLLFDTNTKKNKK